MIYEPASKQENEKRKEEEKERNQYKKRKCLCAENVFLIAKDLNRQEGNYSKNE